MKICVIPPTSHLDFATFGSGMHMALTHLVQQSEGYTKFFQRMQNKKEYVILDNSAFEMEKLGKGLDPEPVLKAAKIIGANEVIATDVLCDGDKTVVSTRAFIQEYNQFYGEEIRVGKPVPKIMAVVQGKTIDEWMDCYVRLLAMKGVDVLGFSKISVPVSFGGPTARTVSGGVTTSRLKLYDYLTERKLWPMQTQYAHKVEVHLLGGDDWTGHELKTIKGYNFNCPINYPECPIRSNDTSAAVWYGAHNVAFDPFSGKASKFIVEKPDLENHRQVTAEKLSSNAQLIQANINVFHKMAN